MTARSLNNPGSKSQYLNGRAIAYFYRLTRKSWISSKYLLINSITLRNSKTITNIFRKYYRIQEENRAILVQSDNNTQKVVSKEQWHTRQQFANWLTSVILSKSLNYKCLDHFIAKDFLIKTKPIFNLILDYFNIICNRLEVIGNHITSCIPFIRSGERTPARRVWVTSKQAITETSNQ